MRFPHQRALRRALSSHVPQSLAPQRLAPLLLAPPLLAPLCVAMMIAGCSSSGNFPGPSWNLTGGKGAAPVPEQPIHRQPQAAGLPATERQPPVYRGGRDPVSGRAPGWGSPQHGLETRPLPPPQQPQQSQPHQAPASAQPPAGQPSRGKPGAASGHLIEVRPGQSLAMIAGEQRVSIAALMQANGLRDPYVIPGQQLVIPPR